jgi:hypothetical protein
MKTAGVMNTRAKGRVRGCKPSKPSKPSKPIQIR